MVFEILSSPIALLSPKRYKILADIESFEFLFLVRWVKTYATLYFHVFEEGLDKIDDDFNVI